MLYELALKRNVASSTTCCMLVEVTCCMYTFTPCGVLVVTDYTVTQESMRISQIIYVVARMLMLMRPCCKYLTSNLCRQVYIINTLS